MKRKQKEEVAELNEQMRVLKERMKLFFEVYTKDRALSGIEKKKLYHLKQYEAGIAKEQVSINTAQKCIPFEKMYEDGILKVNDTFYGAILEFDDLNYELLEENERKEILDQYKHLLNSFDAGFTNQFFFFNRRVSEEKLKERFEIAPQGDAFDEIRSEYVEILKHQAAKGNNGIVKSKYLLIGCEAENEKDARGKLNGKIDDIISSLLLMGSVARKLSGHEWLQLLYEYFVQLPEEDFDFDYERAKEEGTDEKDAIAPKSFYFTKSNEFKTGDNFGATYVLEINNPEIHDDFLSLLLKHEGNFNITIHFHSLKPSDALKEAKGNLTKIQSAKIDEQKKAFRGGYDMDILPPDIANSEKDALELLEELNGADQKLFHTDILITFFGKSRHERDILYQMLDSDVQGRNCELKLYENLQEQCFFSSAPLLANSFSKVKERSLTTEALSRFIPFITQELFMSGNAIYYGTNTLSKKMILADRKRLPNPNGLILGMPGSGKSFSAKREMISVFLQTRDEIIVCDPEGEYYPVVEALGGQVVRLATNSAAFLNPMDIQVSHRGDRDALQLKSSFIITLLDLIAGDTRGLGNDEKGIIDECIRHLYDDYFANPEPENVPILSDLYEALLKYDPRIENPYMEEHLCKEAQRQATRIANSLKLYVSGSQNYFNHRTNIDSQNRILCFDIKDLSAQLKEIGMLVVQDAVWNRVSKNRVRGIATRYYCDEFHLLLKEKQTADYSIEMWKRFRKWGGIPTGLTQNIVDFMQGADTEGIVGNSSFLCIFSCGPNDRKVLKEQYKLTKDQLDKITNAEKGSGLLIFDHYIIPFTDKYPKDKKTYAIMNTRPRDEEDMNGIGSEC